MCKHLLYFGLSLLLCSSCAEQYDIYGKANLKKEGKMAYLKHFDNQHSSVLDSCEVVHGNFWFSGLLDTIMIATLYMDNEKMMPIVIENAQIAITLNNVEQKVSGGPLNERLYRFIQKRNYLLNSYISLPRKKIKYLRRGKNMKKINEEINAEKKRLKNKLEALETAFIMDNYSNILGTSYFLYLCKQQPTPSLTPQIKKIWKQAPALFKNNPTIKHYMATVMHSTMP